MIVRRALVLLADHELNASAFAVRVVASTGASLGACLNAGLSALSGPLHGGTTSRVEILFEEVDKAGDAAAVVETRLRRGDGVPGFEHPLYPDGDPRATALLPLLREDATRDALANVMNNSDGRLPISISRWCHCAGCSACLKARRSRSSRSAAPSAGSRMPSSNAATTRSSAPARAMSARRCAKTKSAASDSDPMHAADEARPPSRR